MKTAIQAKDAPAAIGTYSQAIRAGDTVYLSGQIGFDPSSMQLVEGIEAQIQRVFRNHAAPAGKQVLVEAMVERAEIVYRPRRQLVVHALSGTHPLALRFFNFYPSQ